MKNLSILLLFCVLFQSCYSYKTVHLDKNTIKLSKKHKIVLTNLKKVEGKVLAMSKDTLLLSMGNQKIKISTSNIFDIQERKFSFLKTAGSGALLWIVAPVVVLVLLLTGGPLQ